MDASNNIVRCVMNNHLDLVSIEGTNFMAQRTLFNLKGLT